MTVDLSPGEAIRIGAAVTLIVVAVEGDRVRFGLETPEGASPAGDPGPDGEQAGRTHRRNGWEGN
jgi:Global regulator protein family